MAAFDLVHDVGDVAGDVSGVAVGLDDDTVLVVTEGGGPQPPGTVGLVEVAVLLEHLDGPCDGTGLEQGVLVEEHIEVRAELVEGTLDVGEHHVHAAGPEGLLHRRGILLENIRDIRFHGVGYLADVGAAVSVPGGRFPLCRCDE